MNITVHKLHDMRIGSEPHTLLDIRETHELEVCSIGGRSAQVVNWLIQNGYNNALNLEGGISAWAQIIDTNMAQY